ncbi:ribosome assembly factor SBDS [Vulcanisaeta souniana]|uniref:rRNA metabolism protein n=1 Tax=Vulcanisaeta souniana JCM 11219 TaxID=1293586 RepID=A0A830E3S6_9CREN|nr:ribosome assembly factor SBDS [Vulcanisaeta souniana]BDR92110.1 rRNA metabolism protein [Vulcanisaeta souniana JCM 11219]GGI67815.1 rRNA metabolism protein [Vulcanisaeta souniana JCM 11219]
MSKRNYVIARYEKDDYVFEILVDPDAALDMRLGKSIGIDKVLITDTIYKDARKGLRASEESLMRVFKTTDPRRVAEFIVKNGELPLTADQRRRLIEQKRKQVIDWISRNCIDTRTRTPVPPQRVEAAMQQVDVTIDPFKPVEEQVNAIIKALQRILPLKVAVSVLEVRAPADYAHKVRSNLSRMGRVVKERFEGDGSLVMQLEVPAGLQDTIIAKVNELTHGTGDVRIVSTS